MVIKATQVPIGLIYKTIESGITSKQLTNGRLTNCFELFQFGQESISAPRVGDWSCSVGAQSSWRLSRCGFRQTRQASWVSEATAAQPRGLPEKTPQA